MTPVFRLSHTIRGTDPTKNSYMATWAASHVFCCISKVGSTNAYRENGKHATNRYTVWVLPVTGSSSCIVGPDQSTSTSGRPYAPPPRAPPIAAHFSDRSDKTGHNSSPAAQMARADQRIRYAAASV